MHADRQIPGWFPEINRNHLIWLMRSHDVRVVLEIGAFLGKSTVFFAERCEMVYSVDHWAIDCLTSEDEKRFCTELGLPREFRTIWDDNLKQASKTDSYFAPIIVCQPGDYSLRNRAEETPPDLPDLVYIDGSHQYQDVVSDIRKYGALATKIICGDDYGVAEGVTRAVDESFPEPGPVGTASRLHIAPPFWWTEVGG